MSLQELLNTMKDRQQIQEWTEKTKKQKNYFVKEFGKTEKEVSEDTLNVVVSTSTKMSGFGYKSGYRLPLMQDDLGNSYYLIPIAYRKKGYGHDSPKISIGRKGKLSTVSTNMGRVSTTRIKAANQNKRYYANMKDEKGKEYIMISSDERVKNAHRISISEPKGLPLVLEHLGTSMKQKILNEKSPLTIDLKIK